MTERLHFAERLMFRAGVKWHEEGEKNTAYFRGLMNSKYSRLELIKVTNEAGMANDRKTINEKKNSFCSGGLRQNSADSGNNFLFNQYGYSKN